MNKERKTLTHKFGDARCRLPPCRVEGCCRVGDKFLAITKKCLEVGGYVQRWEDAAGGYRTQPHLHPTCGYHNQKNYWGPLITALNYVSIQPGSVVLDK